MDKNEPIRLQKLLSQQGIASRRKVEELIRQGNIRVNGKAAKLGDRVTPADKIYINGKRVAVVRPEHRYIMLNKPRGFITTMSDERGRKCVAQLVEDVGTRVYPVGRLDRDSEGMLIFTNDGEFANKITHPRNNIYKIYRVTVRPPITEEQLVKLETGVLLDGRNTAPASVRVLTQKKDRTVLEITLREGKNREIRRMCESAGLEVARLRRIQIGSVSLGMLKQGDWRDLTEAEVRRLTANPFAAPDKTS